MEKKEIEDIQALINIFFPFAEELIVKFGEFFPYAGATNLEGEFVSVGLQDEIKHLSSAQVINSLKASLKSGHDKYIVTAVFYQVSTTDAVTDEKQDAIGVFVEHKEGQIAYDFFYPYVLGGDDNFEVNESYGNAVPKEIF